MTVRRKHIRHLVDQLLDENRVDSPPIPIERIAKRHGAAVQRAPAEDELSGFLLQSHGNRRAVIGVNANHHKNRQAFTIAHELGHLLLHDLDDIHVDRGFSVKLRSSKSSEGTDFEEKEANLFAAELLIPQQFIEDDLEAVDAVDLADEGCNVIAKLAKQYRVSVQAMTFRLSYLGYVQL